MSGRCCSRFCASAVATQEKPRAHREGATVVRGEARKIVTRFFRRFGRLQEKRHGSTAENAFSTALTSEGIARGALCSAAPLPGLEEGARTCRPRKNTER